MLSPFPLPSFETLDKHILLHSVAGARKRINPLNSSSAVWNLKGHESSLCLFKATGEDSEADSCLIYPQNTYSLLLGTKLNPDPPQIDQTSDFVDWWEASRVLW